VRISVPVTTTPARMLTGPIVGGPLSRMGRE
jgi:hypothetical protein